MRKEQVAEVLDQMPAQVAAFDDSGIRTAINLLSGSGLLPTFIDVIRTDVQAAIQVLEVIWIIDSQVRAALINPTKVSTAYNATIKLLPVTATPGQVTDAIIAFLSKLLQ